MPEVAQLAMLSKTMQSLQDYIIKYNILRGRIYRIDFRSNEKIFIATRSDGGKYAPDRMKSVIYKTENRNDKYKKIIEGAIQKI